ncbi:MAG: 30S ribosomal protein S3 [Candidatus Magasanikbacteria bacterium RIFOXYC2_FULL_42_28]|uniref:Small ribosomal subunit protein uS3 n=1 Tax=Candidatus Magasanikbacteria bacterium RIFOXYC2_FULL_42_28 TaxID=1798704 RepID=A0A1F6NUI4_9BACT|nr:MAG: 30S ribosomal protein S3 [Candidatus Magasanikbacteria bacterium RIFOXYC2_FULL_42_28]
MGHKVHPKIHRTPLVNSWDSKWFGRKEQLPGLLKQEVQIREYLDVKLKDAGIDSVSVERTPKEVTITILAAKPGVVIGRSGQGLEVLKKDIEKKILQFKHRVKLNILPVNQPALSARIVGAGIVSEIERRMPFRRVMKQAIEKVMAAGAQGVKIKMSGRLNGVEIARQEVLGAGKMSLITFRSNVDYAIVEAQTLYGKIGVKVWVYRGEVFSRLDKFGQATEKAAAKPAGRKSDNDLFRD